MKIFKSLFFLITALAILVPSNVLAKTPTPTPSPAVQVQNVQPQLINSYEAFWPISAGKVIGEPLYFLKSLKESLRELLIFSDFKKADYNIRLSEKRAVEAEKLFIEKKDYGNAKAALNAAQEKREKALSLIQKVESKSRNVTDLKNTLRSSLEKQHALLVYIGTQIPEEQKVVVEENTSDLSGVLASLE